MSEKTLEKSATRRHGQMTTAQKHAARLRDWAERINNLISNASDEADKKADAETRAAYIDVTRRFAEKILDLLAGAEALEAQGAWRIVVRGEKPYLVPAADYKQAIESPELIGSAVCADDVVITGWRR